MAKNKLKLTIVTITSNNPDIKSTLESISTQNINPNDFEHIIIDNLSTDGTQKLVKNYIKKAPYKVIYIREKDNGRYNAMNKGIKKASGKYLSFMNAGDQFYNKTSLTTILKNSEDKEIVYGNLNVIDHDKSNIYIPPDTLDFKYFLNSALPHQASIIKKSLFDKYGLYDEKLQISADHNFFLKTIIKHNCLYKHLNSTIATYYFNGISSDPKNKNKINQEKEFELQQDFTDLKFKKIKSKQKAKFTTPILFMIFNRQDTTQTVFGRIKQIKPKYLYVAADGPRPDRPDESIKCQQTRNIINQIDWECELKTLYRKVNFGCGNSVYRAITWFFNNVKEGIILEDDCLPDISFFNYCQTMLQKYENDNRITHINGTSFVKKPIGCKDSYYYSKFFHVWGWATWRRAWENYDFNISTYPKFKDQNLISSLFTKNAIQQHWISNFNLVYTHQLDTWDYQWVYSNLTNHGLAIMPFKNLVSNIGFDEEATHTIDKNSALSNLSSHSFKLDSEPEDMVPRNDIDEQIYEKTTNLKLSETFFTRFKDKVKKNIPNIFLTLLFVSILSLFAYPNINYPSFWFDESGQFWISQGLNHYSAPFSPIGNIVDVIQNNIKHNLDPGGFSIILHFWNKISTSPTFLRLLPFIFIAISVYLVSKLSQKFFPDSKLTYLAGLTLLLSPLIKQYSFELRPYSMEVLATVTALYFIYDVEKILSRKLNSIFSGIILAILLTSRYSSIISILTAIFLIFIKTFRIYQNRKKIINFLLLLLPVILCLISIYIFTLRFQNPNSIAPLYVKEYLLKYTNITRILDIQSQKNIIPFGIIFGLFLASFIFKPLRKYLAIANNFFLFTLILNLSFVLLSFMGMYPWSINSRWNISINTLFTISWIPLFFIVLNFLSSYNLNLFKVFKYSTALAFVIFIFFNTKSFKYTPLDNTYLNIVSNNPNPTSNLLINVGAMPTTKYLMEYGPLKYLGDSNFYKNLSTFNHANYILNSSIQNLDQINRYNFILLTHIDFENSDIKNILSNNPNWIDISEPGYSKLYYNTKAQFNIK